MSPGDAAGPLLEIRGATRRFGERRALAGVDLTLHAGEIFALIGPNGAGKTTLVRAVSGRLALDGGSVRAGGRDPRGDPDARRLLGLVPQAIALYPHLTAQENLEVLGTLCGVPRADLSATVANALERTGLDARRGDRTETLSGGMQRRLNIAAGILHGPRLLLLDEPTVGVDPTARERIHELLRSLRRDGLAILLTTHDLEQAAELADRVAVLIDGRIRAEGTPRGLVEAAFGGAREIVVLLAADPDERGRHALADARLAAVPGSRTWSGPLEGGFGQVPDLEARLGAAGVAVAEIRVREPGLQGAFFQLTGEALEP